MFHKIGLATSKELLHYLLLPFGPPRFMHYFVVTHKSSISNAHGQIFNVMEPKYDVPTCVQMYMYVCTYRWPCGTHAHTHTSSYLRTPHNTQAHNAHTQCTYTLNTPSRRDCLTAIVLLLWSESQVRHCKDGKIRNPVGQPVTHPDGYS